MLILVDHPNTARSAVSKVLPFSATPGGSVLTLLHRIRSRRISLPADPLLKSTLSLAKHWFSRGRIGPDPLIVIAFGLWPLLRSFCSCVSRTFSR